MRTVPKPIADFGDWVADAILDAIDKEPEELRDRLLGEIKRGEHQVQRTEAHVLVQFPTAKIQYVIPLLQAFRPSSDRLN
jgi:hypothetical protein